MIGVHLIPQTSYNFYWKFNTSPSLQESVVCEHSRNSPKSYFTGTDESVPATVLEVLPSARSLIPSSVKIILNGINMPLSCHIRLTACGLLIKKIMFRSA